MMNYKHSVNDKTRRRQEADMQHFQTMNIAQNKSKQVKKKKKKQGKRLTLPNQANAKINSDVKEISRCKSQFLNNTYKSTQRRATQIRANNTYTISDWNGLGKKEFLASLLRIVAS